MLPVSTPTFLSRTPLLAALLTPTCAQPRQQTIVPSQLFITSNQLETSHDKQQAPRLQQKAHSAMTAQQAPSAPVSSAPADTWDLLVVGAPL